MALGGAVGTLGRYAVSQLTGTTHLLPWATLVVNVVGAFLLGLLLEALARAGAETALTRLLRLGLGTGMLGGFTTYSALALEVTDLMAGDHLVAGLSYGLGSVLAGLLACAAGIVLGGGGARRAEASR